jgi:hypothetical protein
MRTITVSIALFARIWACRQDGEESLPISTPNIGGHTERVYGVHFAGGFGISRTYLGKQFAANAVQQGWVLASDSKTYHSLNALSRAIGAKSENAWLNWFYFNDEGKLRPIADLRNPDEVARRARIPARDVKQLLAELDALPSKPEHSN